MEIKPWYTSLTIQAASVVAFLQVIPDLINEISQVAPGLHIETNPIVMKVLTVVGTIVAIYGRLTAKTAISK